MIGYRLGLTAFVLFAAAPGSASAEELSEELGALEPLVGSCWEGRFAGLDLTDIRCVTAILDGRHVRDVHEVVGTGYRGETIYSWDAATGAIVFTYYNVNGDAIRGTVAEVPTGLTGSAIRLLANGGEQRLAFQLTIDADRLIQRSFEDGQQSAEIRFERRPANTFPELFTR